MNSGVYKILNIKTGKVYIGSSNSVKKRWKFHLFHLHRRTHHSILLQRAWDKYGEKSFVFLIIEKINSSKDLIPREQFWLNFFSSTDPSKGYNLLPTAGSNLGAIRTPESKKRLSQSKMGKVCSPETRAKLSIRMLKKWSDPEFKTKMMLANKKLKNDPLFKEKLLKVHNGNIGRIHSDETRGKMSTASKGKPKSEKHKANLSKAARKRSVWYQLINLSDE